MDLPDLVRAEGDPLSRAEVGARPARTLGRPAAWLGSAFLASFALDALVSLADELAWLAGGSRALVGARELFAALPLLLSLPVSLVLPFCAGWPSLAFVPPLAFLLWVSLGALPLPFWLPTREAGLALSLLQAALAGLAFLAVHRRSRAGSWLVRDADLAAAPLRARRVVVYSLASVALVPPLLVGYGLLALSLGVERATAGFMRFDLSGIASDDREYLRGDERVRLVGMIHVGSGEAYDRLFASFDADSVVLEEGVTDEQGRLSRGFSYAPLAAGLGLEQQPHLEAVLEARRESGVPERELPRVVRADVDASEFSEETLAFLRGIARVLASPDLATAFARAGELGGDGSPEWSAALWRDLVERRNAHLIGKLDANLAPQRTLVVPWGALHLPGIEQALLARGFERVSARSHALVAWADVARGLSRRAAPVAGAPGPALR